MWKAGCGLDDQKISPPFEGGESAKRWGGSQGTAQRTNQGALRGFLRTTPTRFASLPSFKKEGSCPNCPNSDATVSFFSSLPGRCLLCSCSNSLSRAFPTKRWSPAGQPNAEMGRLPYPLLCSCRLLL